MKTAPAPEAPARPASGAVPSAEPLHGPVDTAEDSLDGLQTAFGALSVEEVVSEPQPVKGKRENESEKDAGEGADEGEEQGQDPTHDPTFEGAPSASGLHASPSPITTTLPAAATSTSTTNPPMAEGTGFTVMPPYPAYGMGPPTTALHEATTASEPVASSSAPRWYAADYPHPLQAWPATKGAVQCKKSPSTPRHWNLYGCSWVCSWVCTWVCTLEWVEERTRVSGRQE